MALTRASAAVVKTEELVNNRNRIINGDMRIDQRNAGAAVTASGSYPVDRFVIVNTTDGAFSAQQDSSAPAGFVNSLKFTTTTADASLASTQICALSHRIEGTYIADMSFGTANAKTITVSFWVRSSLTGTFGGAIINDGFNRSYPFSYTISSADTWEYKTVTLVGDTTGTWLNTTGRGMVVNFSLAAGADRVGTAGSWVGANNQGVSGQVQVIGTLNATWYITGVQLEVGSVATSFERRPFGTELALCQRYFEKIGFGDSNSRYPTVGGYVNASSVSILQSVAFAVTKRAIPTITAGSAATFSCTASVDGPSVNGFRLIATSTTSGFISASFTSDGVTASIEL
jgi:hypothetical protein